MLDPTGHGPAGFVPTTAHRFCAATIAAAAQEHSSCVITSRVPGVGKTTSASQAAAGTGRHHVLIAPSPQTNVVSLTAQLLLAAGVRPPHRVPMWELVLEVVDLFSELGPTITVVDDAHHLDGEGIAHLQVLHQRIPQHALVLIGSHRLATRDRTRRELLDRPDRWLDMPPLVPKEMLDALTAADPMFATAPPRRLLDIDDRWAHGRWRRWSQFQRVARTYTSHAKDPLDDERIDHTLTALGWNHRPDPTRADR